MISCAFENGNSDSLRHVTVVSIVTNDKGQILLTKRSPQLLRGNTYTIPGGFLNRNEDTKAGALRELREETGIEGKIQMLFRINDNPYRPKEDRQNVDFVYIVTYVSGTLTKTDETTELAWFDFDKIPPDSEFAFDHHESIVKYKEYLEHPFEVPIIG